MFFLPWAVGIVIMVLACIAGVVFIRVLPLWGGFLIGTALFYLWKAAMGIENIVALALFMAIAPAVALGGWGLYLDRKAGDKESIPQQIVQMAITTLLASPFTAALADLLLGLINPTGHMNKTVTEINNPEIITQQLAIWQIKVDSFYEARHLLGWYEDKWITLLIIAFFIYAVGRFVEELKKGIDNVKKQQHNQP